MQRPASASPQSRLPDWVSSSQARQLPASDCPGLSPRQLSLAAGKECGPILRCAFVLADAPLPIQEVRGRLVLRAIRAALAKATRIQAQFSAVLGLRSVELGSYRGHRPRRVCQNLGAVRAGLANEAHGWTARQAPEHAQRAPGDVLGYQHRHGAIRAPQLEARHLRGFLRVRAAGAVPGFGAAFYQRSGLPETGTSWYAAESGRP